jgi:integrase
MRRILVPACERAELDAVRFHDLRHFAATYAISLGAHPRAIQERLGHASITTTIGIHGALFPSLDEDLAARMDEQRGADLEAFAAEREEAEVVPLAR